MLIDCSKTSLPNSVETHRDKCDPIFSMVKQHSFTLCSLALFLKKGFSILVIDGTPLSPNLFFRILVSPLLSMNKISSQSLSNGLPTMEGSYNKIPTMATDLTNSVPKLVTTAKTANAKIKKPKTIFPPEQEKNLEYLFKYMG